MTAIGGCISLTGAPVDRELVQRMGNVLNIYGRDDSSSILVMGAGFVRVLLRITPEDRFDSQPLHHSASGTILLFDGRLDNRSELAKALGVSFDDLATMADSYLVLLAFLRFGTKCFEKLLGDYCIAVWQQRERRLILARDPLGIRPLFWACSKGLFAFGTMPKAMFAVPGVSKEFSDSGLHDYMCMMPVQGEQYLFRDIFRLEPGCLLILSGSNIHRSRFHSFANVQELRLSSSEEYVDAFSDVFEASVGAQLRSCGLVSSHLSGGFDSGTVTAVAARQLAKTGSGLAAYTSVPRIDVRERLRPGSVFDETCSAAELALHFPNISHELVEPLDESFSKVVREEVELFDSPPLNVSNSSWIRAINVRAEAQGARVILTGMFGNASVSYSGQGLFPYYLRSGKFRDWWAEARASVSARPDWQMRTVFKHSFFPFLPTWLWVLYQRFRGRDPRVKSYSPANSDLMKRLDTKRRAARLGWDLTYKPVGDSRRLREQILARQEIGIYFAGANSFGLEWRDPTANRRVVEFCLSVPEEQYWNHGVDRWLLRRYLGRILPAEVVRSRQRGVQGADWAVRVKEQLAEISSDLTSLSDASGAGEIVDMVNLRRSLKVLPNTKTSSRSAEMEYKIKLLRGLTASEFVRYTSGGNE